MRLIGLTGGIGSGKSTVARLFAERGAIVVDADRVAREVVEPGEPALAEIVEHFGPDVVGADGRLDRPALAAIVFGDDEARRALEGITHPRIGQRVGEHVEQARADEQADGQERVVVVDHPLLVESGAVAGFDTVVVVETPVDVRVRRLVEARGMDEADVRNRIESQMRREDRNAIATHVIDNSGDMVDLISRVDRVWEQIEVLPATDADDLVKPVDTTRVAWVFGYGSLVSPASLARTIGRLAKPGKGFHPATLTGYGRRWNYGVGHVTGSWTTDDGTDVIDGTIVALGLIESADEQVNGAIASLTADELADLDHRERSYDRVDVTTLIVGIDDVDLGGLPVFTYVPRASAVERYESARNAGTGAIRRTYWNLVDDAFGRLGENERTEYHESTPVPDVPIVDMLAG